jgi:hypothetical protein
MLNAIAKFTVIQTFFFITSFSLSGKNNFHKPQLRLASSVVGKFAKIQHRNESDKIQKISLLNRDFRFASL